MSRLNGVSTTESRHIKSINNICNIGNRVTTLDIKLLFSKLCGSLVSEKSIRLSKSVITQVIVILGKFRLTIIPPVSPTTFHFIQYGQLRGNKEQKVPKQQLVFPLSSRNVLYITLH